MIAIIKRTEKSSLQTLGSLSIFNNNELLYKCRTLELEEDVNAVRDDCIPTGSYTVVKRWSKKYGDHFHVTNVEGRDYILIHAANYHFQLLGCIAVGQAHIDINKDGLKDVTNSNKTMQDLNNILPKEFTLIII